jgi:hypothetical protein
MKRLSLTKCDAETRSPKKVLTSSRYKNLITTFRKNKSARSKPVTHHTTLEPFIPQRAKNRKK